MSSRKPTGAFTAATITALLRAIPQTNGTYAEIARQAQRHGVTISRYTISSWVNKGRRDVKAHRPDTSYAVFAKEFDALKDRHCSAEQNRRREIERALAELEQTCECGQKKALLSGGRRAEACPRCMEIDGRSQRR